VPLSGVTQVCAGRQFAAALAGGRVYTFGTDHYGSLGGAAVQALTPAPVPVPSGVTVTGIACGGFHVMLTYAGSPIAPLLTKVVGAGKVSFAWRSAPVSEAWAVRYKVTSKEATYEPLIQLPPSARSYVLEGLAPGVRYVVRLKNPVWGRRAMWVIPST
jgi:hypothetical protein